MWTIFKVFLEFVTLLFLFYVLVFSHEAPGNLSSWPGIEPNPPALEDDVLTTGQPGKPQFPFSNHPLSEPILEKKVLGTGPQPTSIDNRALDLDEAHSSQHRQEIRCWGHIQPCLHGRHVMAAKENEGAAASCRGREEARRAGWSSGGD